jgi:hypothetical protein
MTTGGFALIISGSALASVVFCALIFFAILASDAGVSAASAGFAKIVAPFFNNILVATILLELTAIVCLASGAPRRGLHVQSRSLWIASAICTLAAILATVALVLLYLIITTTYV